MLLDNIAITVGTLKNKYENIKKCTKHKYANEKKHSSERGAADSGIAMTTNCQSLRKYFISTNDY